MASTTMAEAHSSQLLGFGLSDENVMTIIQWHYDYESRRRQLDMGRSLHAQSFELRHRPLAEQHETSSAATVPFALDGSYSSSLPNTRRLARLRSRRRANLMMRISDINSISGTATLQGKAKRKAWQSSQIRGFENPGLLAELSQEQIQRNYKEFEEEAKRKAAQGGIPITTFHGFDSSSSSIDEIDKDLEMAFLRAIDDEAFSYEPFSSSGDDLGEGVSGKDENDMMEE